MAHQQLVKRTVYVAKCAICEETIIQAENPPQARYCLKCSIWVPYEEQSYTGPARIGQTE